MIDLIEDPHAPSLLLGHGRHGPVMQLPNFFIHLEALTGIIVLADSSISCFLALFTFFARFPRSVFQIFPSHICISWIPTLFAASGEILLEGPPAAEQSKLTSF